MRRWVAFGLVLAGCLEGRGLERPVITSSIGGGDVDEAPRTEAPVPYGEVRERVEAERRRLAGLPRGVARSGARDVLLTAVRDGLVPHWIGTEWDFNGTSQTPGEGLIACGYFVSTVLQHAGLEVERVRLAQQASAHIAMTFDSDLRVFRSGEASRVVDALEAEGEGLYVVGFDFHVGFVVVREGTAEFCHSTWIDTAGVQCTDPLVDPAFQSRLHVYSPVLTDRVVDAWLDGASIPTVRRGGIP